MDASAAWAAGYAGSGADLVGSNARCQRGLSARGQLVFSKADGFRALCRNEPGDQWILAMDEQSPGNRPGTQRPVLFILTTLEKKECGSSTRPYSSPGNGPLLPAAPGPQS